MCKNSRGLLSALANPAERMAGLDAGTKDYRARASPRLATVT
jgi:hypothetical protein